MDTRIALQKNTVLNSGDGLTFVIKKEIARGGSCIVYDAVYQADGAEKPVRLKECYPFNLEIRRTESGDLIPDSEDKENFEKIKDSIRCAFHEGNNLFLSKGLTNYVSNMLHCFEQNQTIYIPSVYMEGETLSYDTFFRLKDCICIVKTVSEVLERIHQAGYLYLDLKPENIWILSNVSGTGITELVQLFDFDSLVEVKRIRQGEEQGVRLSYTRGFAALEHQMGQIFRIGFYTDVYSVGAVLFYLLFGTPPRAQDCEESASYDFSKSKYGDVGYQDRLFSKLTDFFHRTLANYRYDRYQTMSEVVEELNALVCLADTSVPYIISTVVIPDKIFVGRDTETEKLKEWAEQGQSCLFLTGMGGIGKSSLVRHFLSVEGNNYDTMLYLYYKKTIQDLIIDDTNLLINTIEKGTEETENDYFQRKLRILKRILFGKKAILVVDNFFGEISEDFQKILDVGWKVLVISRAAPPSDSYTSISLKALGKKEDLYGLFEQYVGQKTREDEVGCLDHLIQNVEGHTLALELIARQIRKSRLTLAEAEKLAVTSGFSDIAPEKVRFEKDNETKAETIRNIILTVFSYQDNKVEKKRILKALSLFGQEGVFVDMFMEVLTLSSKDTLNELEEEGWIACSGTVLHMHPVIRETVGLWEWNHQNLEDAEHLMEYLFIQLKLEAEREEYPLALLQNNEYLREIFETDTWVARQLRKYAKKNGFIGRVFERRIENGNLQRVTDHKKVKELVRLSESVLESSAKVERLYETDIWKELMAKVLLSMPVERETYIVNNTELLLDNPACKKGYMMMRLYHKLLSVYLEQYEKTEAWKLLKKIRKIISRSSHFIKAQYYDMLADYYDTCLNGHYDTDDTEENLHKLLKAIDQSIIHIKLAKGGRKKTLRIQYMLNKANVLIRSKPEKKKEIKKILNHAGTWIQGNTQIFSKLRWSHMMSLAWYYTLAEPDEENADFYCRCAKILVNDTCETELEYIDIIVIPYANIMTEFGSLEKARDILLSGIQICEKYPEMLPYFRKKEELNRYLTEVKQYMDAEA
ncbi:hypothetical protein B5F13_00385 [Drancourtella sp. An177]|nr:hypothetical protein B5F13_00385 [Drancourtella sp. An177]